jgi:hypothetical protein
MGEHLAILANDAGGELLEILTGKGLEEKPVETFLTASFLFRVALFSVSQNS